MLGRVVLPIGVWHCPRLGFQTWLPRQLIFCLIGGLGWPGMGNMITLPRIMGMMPQKISSFLSSNLKKFNKNVL